MYKTVICIFILLISCKTDSQPEPKVKEDPWKEDYVEISYSMSGVSNNDNFNPIMKAGSVENAQLKEASGLVHCTFRNDWLYSHNDGGDYNRIFVLDTNGKNVGHIIVPNSGNRDSEDIAIDPDIDGQSFIYWGDIGDNDGKYAEIIVYRFPEKPFDFSLGNVTADAADRIVLNYPDGAKDAETLLIDPWNHHMYVVTKREAKGRLYRVDYPFDTVNATTMKKVAQLPFSGIVAGDISSDGHHIVLKTYVQAFYWYREEGETLIKALSREPTQIPYQFETQGESFCWSKDANSYYTISEGKNKPIYRGSRKQ